MQGGEDNRQHKERKTATRGEYDVTRLELEEEWLTRIGVGGWV